MTGSVSSVNRFKANAESLAEFIHDLISDCDSKGYKEINPALIGIGVRVISGMNPSTLIDKFIIKSHKIWDEIERKEEIFFIDHAGEIFGSFANLNAFKYLVTLEDKNGTKVVPEDDREYIWGYFHSLVKISIKYIHEMRKPQIRMIDGTERVVYTDNFFKDIKLNSHAERWEVELTVSS